MGVKNLSDLFEESSIDIRIQTQLSDYSDKLLAFDAFNVLFQFMASIRDNSGQSLVDDEGNVTSHLIGILTRNCNLIQEGIVPVYVFDGKETHELKSEVQEERREKRKVAEKEYEKAVEEGDMVRARKFASRVNKLTSSMIDDAKTLLNYMGIPVIQAPAEGEAQAAQLSKEGSVYGVASQDYDSLLFGGSVMVRNVNITGRRSLPGGGTKMIYPEEIHLDTLLEGLDLTREQLIDVGILLGSDFNPDGIYGIGPKTAYKYINKYGSFTEITANVDKVAEANIPYDDIKSIFLNPNVKEGLKLDRSSSFEGDKIIHFLVNERNFSEGRYTNLIRKTEEVIEDNQKQKSLDDFF